MPLLEIRNLCVSFATRSGRFKAVDGVDLTIEPNEVLAVVGESGSGKSVAMLAVMGLLPFTATVTADRLAFEGRDLLSIGARERRQIAGKQMAMIFQEPMTSLNPCFTAGFQIDEALKTHLGLGRAARKKRVIELLEEVGIPDPVRRAGDFPHQLSGGMSQRVMIAMALACRPQLLIADEPTTALDVTIQAQILDLLMALRRQNGMSLLLITHDMGVVAETADRVIVQYAGQKVEANSTRALFADPHHPYTAALLSALPEHAQRAPARRHPRRRSRPARPAARLPVFAALRLRVRALPPDRARPRLPPARRGALPHAARAWRPAGGCVRSGGAPMTPLLEARGLARNYKARRGLFAPPATVKALAGVSFTLDAGRTLAVVGESGCGKSTLARLLTFIEPPSAGALDDRGRRRRAGRRNHPEAPAPGNPDRFPESLWLAQSPPEESARRSRSRCWSIRR